MPWVCGRPFHFFLMFILVKAQLKCYHLHFTHRKLGLREHKGLLGHVALNGQCQKQPPFCLSWRSGSFWGSALTVQWREPQGASSPPPTSTCRLPAPSSRAQQASLEGHSLSMFYYSS